MNNVGISVHRTSPEGFKFFRSFLSRDGIDEFSCVKLLVKTSSDSAGFDFYFDVDHKDPITITVGEDTIVIPGRDE